MQVGGKPAVHAGYYRTCIAWTGLGAVPPSRKRSFIHASQRSHHPGSPAHLQHRVICQQLRLQGGHVAVEAAVVHLLHSFTDAAGGGDVGEQWAMVVRSRRGGKVCGAAERGEECTKWPSRDTEPRRAPQMQLHGHPVWPVCMCQQGRCTHLSTRVALEKETTM